MGFIPPGFDTFPRSNDPAEIARARKALDDWYERTKPPWWIFTVGAILIVVEILVLLF